MLRPMLTQWLDDNLPTLVERLVREEIERVSRGNRAARDGAICSKPFELFPAAVDDLRIFPTLDTVAAFLAQLWCKPLSKRCR
jgi:hypothetical protein